MPVTNNLNEIIKEEKQLLNFFFSGCKTEEKIGVETEKLLIYKKDASAVKYSDILKILNMFDKNIWTEIKENNNVLGLKSDFGTISLEPGSQVELSLKPFENLKDIENLLSFFYKNLNLYAEKFAAEVLNSGIQPVSTYENINVIPKQRYKYMSEYLPTKNLTPFVMMRETAGIQANFDYKSEEDAVKKLKIAIKMSPFISAVYANSPIRNNKKTNFKSLRANSWLNVDEDRCGYIHKDLFDKNKHFSFEHYAQTLLDIPMIFIQRENNFFPFNKTFRDFLQNGYMGMKATLSDWENHLSLYFPDVRLKNYIEIRNHDAQNDKMTFSVPAFWKGIIYNQNAIDEIEKILSIFTFEDYTELRKYTPIYAINTKIKKYKVKDFVKEFFDISFAGLKSNNKNEERYLEPVYEYICLNRVPADDILAKYNTY